MDPGPAPASAPAAGDRLRYLPFLRASAVGWRSSRLTTLVAYGLMVLAFAVAIIAIEVALGDPLVSARTPGTSHSVEDACWHLGTGLALALPARRWTAAWMGSIMTLGLDTDHIFGDVLPSVTGRTDHCVVFLLGAVLVLYFVQGRTGGLLVAGAFTAHVSLDGGSFALFAPFSTAQYSLPFAVTVLGALAAATMFLLAFRPASDLKRPAALALVAAVTVGCLVAFVALTGSSTFLIN